MERNREEMWERFFLASFCWKTLLPPVSFSDSRYCWAYRSSKKAENSNLAPCYFGIHQKSVAKPIKKWHNRLPFPTFNEIHQKIIIPVNVGIKIDQKILGSGRTKFEFELLIWGVRVEICLSCGFELTEKVKAIPRLSLFIILIWFEVSGMDSVMFNRIILE